MRLRFVENKSCGYRKEDMKKKKRIVHHLLYISSLSFLSAGRNCIHPYITFSLNFLSCMSLFPFPIMYDIKSNFCLFFPSS